METKKTYAVLTAVLGFLQLYALYNIVMSFVNGYSLEWKFILYFLPVCLGSTGVLLFAISRFKKSGLLRLYMCYELFSFPFTILFYTSFFTRDYGEFSYRPPLDWNFYMGVLLDLLYVGSCAAGLWYLSKERVAKIMYSGEGSNRIGQFEPAPAALRFANRLIDGGLVIFVVVKGIASLYYWIDKRWLPGSNITVYFFETGALLLYYLLLEGIFKTTAGKCATNTVIVNEHGEPAGFLQIVLRTLGRLIPFEAFSFFGSGARGWHDSVSNTWVVESTGKDDITATAIFLDAEKQSSD